jgi:hypothetical protein
MTKEECHMPNEIDVASLTTCWVAADGSYVSLNFEEALGRPGSLRLTSDSIQKLLMTLPRLLSTALRAQHRDSSVRAVFPLSEWRLEKAAGSPDFILTAMTADGFEVAFSLDTQVAARMASALEEHGPMAEQGLAGLAS